MSENHQTNSIISPDIPWKDLQFEKPIKLAVMASGSGTNFEAIAQAIADQKLHAQVQVLIYNNPDAKVVEKAAKWGIKTVLINHRQFKNRETFDQEIVNTLQNHDVEWIIMAGWMRCATKVLVDAFPDKIINIHPSLLPSFKGIKGVEKTLNGGVKIAGCTVHLVSLEVDSGPILMQAAVPILPDDTSETLHARIQVQEHIIFPKAIALAAKMK